VPDRARNLYDKVEVYRSQTGRLDIIVEKYNDIIATLLPVEKPLMIDRINKLNKSLQPGMDTLKWNSPGIDKFIDGAMAITEVLDELVKKMKENVRKMIEMMNTWSSEPLYQRKQRTQAPEDVESIHNASVSARLEVIEKEGKDIMKLMKDTVDNIKPDKKSFTWLAYVDYVNGLVIEGITNAIDSSMHDLAQQININYNLAQGLAPIFMINVCLDENQIQFDPSITCNDMQTGIRDIINNIVGHFISLSIRMPQRLDYPQGGGDYLPEIKDQFQLFGAMQQITNNLNEIDSASNEFLDQYNDISFLWEEELESYFENFLKSGPNSRDIYIQSIKA
jgi:dynein heavy chain